MTRRWKMLVAALALVVGMVPLAAYGHSALNHHGCASPVIHGKVYDGYSGGKYWYHSVSWGSSIWWGAKGDYVYSHYYRSGPPSSPVYVYDHYNRVTCWT